MRHYLLIPFIVFFIFFGYGFIKNTEAQTIETPIDINLSPENPGPNQYVNASLTSFGTDLNSANISWQIDGKTKKSGKGEKNFSFTTGEVNTSMNISVSVTTVDGEFITKNLRLKPSGVDLIWQSDGFVPPFYKGKTLFSHQNKITFIAVPHLTTSGGVEISPGNLIYKWIKNGTVIETASGYGKNTFTFVGSVISRPIDIKVEVTSPVVSSLGVGQISLNPIEPSVVLYKKNPLYGIEFQKALTGNVELTDSKELVVLGIPLFFGGANPENQELSYKWFINGSLVDDDTTQNMRVFRQKEGTSGVSKISLGVENTKKILQSAKNQFDLRFELKN